MGGLRLHRLEYPGEGDAVVCVHGVTGHAWLWHGVAAALAPRRVVAVDLRGHGDSQWSPSSAYSTDDHASDLASLLESLALAAVHLVGLSWGGLVALRVAASSPHLVKTLAVVDVPLSFEQGPSDVPERPYSFAGHDEVVAWERQANPHAADDLLEVVASFGVRPGEGGTFVRKHDPFFLRTWPFRTGDHRGEWEAVGAPLLLVRADASYVLSAAAAAAMRAARPDAAFVELADCGHIVPVERPAELASVLSEHHARG